MSPWARFWSRSVSIQPLITFKEGKHLARKRRPNVKAAIEGSREVTEELTGNMSAARNSGSREARFQRSSNGRNKPSQGSGSSSGGKKSVYPISDLVTGGAAPGFTIPSLARFVGSSGKEYTTEVYSDKNFGTRPGLVVVPINDYQWAGLQNANSANQDTRGASWANWMLDLYSAMVRGIQSKGINVPLYDTFLATPANLSAWLTGWEAVYGCVYALESMLAAGNYNLTITNINNAILQNLPTLQALSRRIRQFVVPQGLIDLVAAQHGLKLIDKETAPIWYLSTGVGGTAPIDYQVAANIAGLLTSAETELSTILASAATPDFARIPNTMAKAFAAPNFPTAIVSSDPIEYDQLFNMMACFNDSTSVKNYSFPNTKMPSTVGGAANNEIPIYFRQDAAESGFNTKWCLSLLKAQVFSIDQLAGQASGALPNSQVGLNINESSPTVNFLQVGDHNQFGVFTNVQLLHAGSFTIGALDFLGDQSYWAPLASIEATSAVLDNRMPRGGYRCVYVSTNWLWDESIRLAEDIFLNPIR